MRIAQVSPLFESVPPALYGGTERVVSYLTEELVRLGYDVTLFASGDSQTSARLVPCWPESLRLSNSCPDPQVAHLLMMEQIFARVDQFDIIHFHTEYLHFPLARRHRVPSITTVHGRLDLPHLPPLYQEYIDLPLVSISDSQREPIGWANWQATVHHGLPSDLYPLRTAPGSYLLFSGRIAPEKRPDLAIEIARLAGVELVIAAKVSETDQAYFEQEIRPLLHGSGVRFIGEVSEAMKPALFGGAKALLFPIDWPEPFGLVMIEAMACGTPVIAFRRGSVPEVIDEGVTGMIVNGVEEAAAVSRIESLDRAECRRRCMERFSAERMASDYLEVYRQRARGFTPVRAGELRGAMHADE